MDRTFKKHKQLKPAYTTMTVNQLELAAARTRDVKSTELYP